MYPLLGDQSLLINYCSMKIGDEYIYRDQLAAEKIFLRPNLNISSLLKLREEKPLPIRAQLEHVNNKLRTVRAVLSSANCADNLTLKAEPIIDRPISNKSSKEGNLPRCLLAFTGGELSA